MVGGVRLLIWAPAREYPYSRTPPSAAERIGLDGVLCHAAVTQRASPIGMSIDWMLTREHGAECRCLVVVPCSHVGFRVTETNMLSIRPEGGTPVQPVVGISTTLLIKVWVRIVWPQIAARPVRTARSRREYATCLVVHRMRPKNSALISESRNLPCMELAIISVPGVLGPRMVTHVWMARLTTATSSVLAMSWMAFAT